MTLSLRKAVVLAAFCALPAAGIASHAQNYHAEDVEADERAAEALIADRLNAERARFAPGSPHLARDAALETIARGRSGDMAHGAPFAHEDSEGRFVAADKVRARFGPYGAVGENIMMERDPARAFEPEAFARRAVQGWMNSEGHRANILSPAYDRSGVGVAIEGSYIYATQVFWGPPKQTDLKDRGR